MIFLLFKGAKQYKYNCFLTSNKGFEENSIKFIRTLLFPMENCDELSVLIDSQSLDTQVVKGNEQINVSYHTSQTFI